jgi:HAD superfamily hydrolase (TIGR01509 family)
MERKNIIFDLVGVLFALDTYAIFRRMGAGSVLRYMLTHRKNPFSIAFSVLTHMHEQEAHDYRVIRYKKAMLPRCITEWQEGKKTNREALQEIEHYIYTPEGSELFKSEYERKVINKIITTMFNATSLTDYMHPIIPNIFLVKDIKKYTPHKLYLLSNFDVDAIAAISRSYPDFFSLFDGVVVSGQVGYLKPYPEMYQYILNAYDLRREESLFIDDQHENVVGAEQVGIPCVLYKNPWQLRKDLNKRNVF